MDGDAICHELEKCRVAARPLEDLLVFAVKLLHESNPRSQWTGIYELFPDNVLRLGPFLGAATDHVFIAVGTGICGAAVAECRNMNVPDVSKAPNYLACSSATRSELVVLIREGQKIFAQVDTDSHEYDAFDAHTVTQVEIVADWLASAYAQSMGGGATGMHGAPSFTGSRN